MIPRVDGLWLRLTGEWIENAVERSGFPDGGVPCSLEDSSFRCRVDWRLTRCRVDSKWQDAERMKIFMVHEENRVAGTDKPYSVSAKRMK